MNTRWIRIIVFVAVLTRYGGTEAAFAQDGVFMEAGQGFYFSRNSEVLLLRYQKEAPELFGREGFYEAMAATWNGRNEATAAGIGRGVRWSRQDGESLAVTAGLCRISRLTDNLGQPYQFYGRLAAERKIGSLLISAAWNHISDAKFLFKWPGKNNSENFLTLSLAVLF